MNTTLQSDTDTPTIFAVDFESYYDKDCSITTLGPRGYFSHPDFDAYMVTVVGNNGFRYAGHPKDFDWTMLDSSVVLSHNASFDESLYLFGVEAGWYAQCTPSAWHCTSDMCAFLGLPRSLKAASAVSFDLEVSKTTRDNMKGKRWESMTEEFRKEVTEYAIVDSELCLRLWIELSDGWPQFERNISRMNRKIGQRGLPIDTALLSANLEGIKLKLFEVESSIPWIGEYTPLSRKAFNEQCRKQGIAPPVSLAQDNPEADAWFADHQKQCPWARSVQDFRRINSFHKKLEAFDYGTMPDGRYYGGIMYCGANPTARFSGSGGNLNLQNLPRDEMFGVNFRNMIRPKEGSKLVVCDLAQIEVRTLLWKAGDEEALELIKTHDDIYEVLAILLGMHDPKDGPLRNNNSLRQRVKAMALGCQFGLSGNGFSAYSGLPLDEANEAVQTYRRKMNKVVQLWDSLRQDIEMTSSLGVPLQLELPSGRSMNYGTLRRMKTKGSDGKSRFSYVGKMVRMGQLRDHRVWHGLLAENLAQAIARDILCDMMLRIEAEGYPILMHVHDEIICEVPEVDSEGALKKILDIMSQPPEWIPDIPVAAEGKILDFYSK
jgi:DNA polymerase